MKKTTIKRKSAVSAGNPGDLPRITLRLRPDLFDFVSEKQNKLHLASMQQAIIELVGQVKYQEEIRSVYKEYIKELSSSLSRRASNVEDRIDRNTRELRKLRSLETETETNTGKIHRLEEEMEELRLKLTEEKEERLRLIREGIKRVGRPRTRRYAAEKAGAAAEERAEYSKE